MAPSWTKTETGYTLETRKGTAILDKSGKKWTLTLGSLARPLGTRASFDHAEGALREWGAL